MLVGTKKIVLIQEFDVPPGLTPDALMQLIPQIAIPLVLVQFLRSTQTVVGDTGQIEAALAGLRQGPSSGPGGLVVP